VDPVELLDGGVVGEDGVVDDDEDDDPRGNGASSCVRLQAATKVKLRRESATAAIVGILISDTFKTH